MTKRMPSRTTREITWTKLSYSQVRQLQVFFSHSVQTKSTIPQNKLTIFFVNLMLFLIVNGRNFLDIWIRSFLAVVCCVQNLIFLVVYDIFLQLLHFCLFIFIVKFGCGINPVSVAGIRDPNFYEKPKVQPISPSFDRPVSKFIDDAILPSSRSNLAANGVNSYSPNVNRTVPTTFPEEEETIPLRSQ